MEDGSLCLKKQQPFRWCIFVGKGKSPRGPRPCPTCPTGALGTHSYHHTAPATTAQEHTPTLRVSK